MSQPNNKSPIGLLLQHAGLISSEQLQHALDAQAQYTEIKLGEILVLQQGIREKTIDFFVNQWQEIMVKGQLFPIGYFLRQAHLLNANQVSEILEEQKNNQKKFGTIAVQKGWVKQDTIDFFLQNLAAKSPQLISLEVLEEYNHEILKLERKYADHYLILSRILAWTGGIPSLTKTICQVFAHSTSNIPAGKEIQAVDQFVEGTLIRKWQTSKMAASIRVLRHNLLNNPRCQTSSLLKSYQNILLSGSKQYQYTQEYQELLSLGLIVRESDQIKVSNIIYQQIFNQEFVVKQLNKKRPRKSEIVTAQAHHNASKKELNIINSSIPLVEYTPQSSIATTNASLEPNEVEIKTYATRIKEHLPSEQNTADNVDRPELLTRISSIVTGVTIALLIPLFLTINNYYSSLPTSENRPFNSAKKINRLRHLCNQPNATEINSTINLISQLEENQQQLLGDFPNNCETTLNHMRVTIAPQLGKDNRTLEAVRHLCNVPAGSEMYINAEVWLKRWYNSAAWGDEVKYYLEQSAEYNDQACPAAHFAEYRSAE